MMSMLETPRSSVRTLHDRKNDFLSTPDEPTTRNRSSSSSSSIRSFRSGTTEVYTEPDAKQRKFKRITTTVDVKLSFWDILRGLNPFDKRARNVPVTVVVTDDGEDSDEYEIDRESPFIKNVFVLSNEKDHHGRYIQQQARCTFDTGNHHGNIISREFLMNQLKFPESAFKGKGMKKSYREGISVTGHTLVPEGVIELEWYHAKSTQRYRGMRFLVSPNPRCEMIIGARTIEKHGILAAPNLSNEVVNFKDWKTDYTYQGHTAALKKLQNDLDTLQEDLKDAVKDKNERKISNIRTKIASRQKEIKVADLVLKHYVAKHDLNADPTNSTKQELVDRLAAELKTAQDLLPKHAQTAPNAPQVVVTDINGTQRSSTGLSARALRPRTGARR